MGMNVVEYHARETTQTALISRTQNVRFSAEDEGGELSERQGAILPEKADGRVSTEILEIPAE